MRKTLLLVAVMGLAFGSVATAAVQQGDTELEFLGGWFTANTDTEDVGDTDIIFATGALGYFLTDNLQVAGAALGAWTEVGNADTDLYALGGRAKWHFMPSNQWVPYVGGQLFWGNIESAGSDTDATLWGPIAGLRYELNAYNDFFAEYQYHVWEDEIRSTSDGLGFDDGHALFLGIIHQFK